MRTLMYLRADTEAVLAAALPWFRAEVDGEAVWRMASLHHALDLIGPMELTPPRLRDDGAVDAGDVDPRYHANLLIDAAHPHAAAILKAAAPFAIAPNSPRRTFA